MTSEIKRLGLAAGIVVFAAGVFFATNSETPLQQAGTDPITPTDTRLAPGAQQGVVLEDITYTSHDPWVSNGEIHHTETVCHEGIDALVEADAMVRLEIQAQCHPFAEVTIHHSGIMFADALDADGRLSVEFPALSEHAVFIAELAAGPNLVTQISVPEVHDFDRIALQATKYASFELHALERGATYGDPGHVWLGAAQAGAGQLRTFGRLDQFGAQLVEVYSLRRDIASDAQLNGRVAVSIEAEVNALNCGQDVTAVVIEARGARIVSRDIDMSMPGCDAIGDFLVLNNLFENLKIAAN